MCDGRKIRLAALLYSSAKYAGVHRMMDGNVERCSKTGDWTGIPEGDAKKDAIGESGY